VSEETQLIRVTFDEAKTRVASAFRAAGLAEDDARMIALILATNSLEGVPSHGLHFFGFIFDALQAGRIAARAVPTQASEFGAWEQWDGNQGPGPLNALRVTERAMQIAKQHGIGVVALRNTNHWTRPGYYGRHAANAGFGFMCWANTPAVMPAWGSRQKRLGNNPLVLAMPNGETPIVLDIALSQFSMGRLQTTKMQHEQLPVPGGYDVDGKLTTDPSEILESSRSLPIGYWKGSGLALLLDLFAAILAGGNTTLDRTTNREVDSVSQIFIAFDLANRIDQTEMGALIERVITDLRETWDSVDGSKFRYPGEGAARRRTTNLVEGIPVHPKIWRRICDESGA
jgi:3-dehydro-L-gulonate 2-dehydrogenase